MSEEHSAQLGELGRLEGVAGAEDLKAFADLLTANRHLSFDQLWTRMGEKICVIPS